MSLEYALGVALHPLLHAQRREAGTHGVILVGERRPEQGHDAVSRGLVDGSLVVVDSLHHVVEDRVEKVARLLRITVGQELSGALEVGEQHCYLLAFAFEGGLRAQNFLRQVARRVDRGRANQ